MQPWTYRIALALACLATLGAGCQRRSGEDAGTARSATPEVPVPFRVEPRDAGGGAVQYTVRFPEPHTHYVEIAAILPTDGADEVDLFLPVWTPGSYLVREYSRHVEGLAASTEDDQPLAVHKTRKNRWRVAVGGADRIILRYRLYARELSVRTSFVDESIAVLNGAATFITLREDRDRPHDLLLQPPTAWEHSVTSLAPHSGGEEHRYVAEDYDELVDAPIVLGTAALYDFTVEGTPHRLANFGEGGVWDGPRSARDVETLVTAHVRFWKTMPHDRYVFLNLLLGGRGGLEHEDSTLMLASPWDSRRREDYIGWLGLTSHEYFHTWNGKRLRPVELGPFDYENETYTRGLWVVEGITSYYDDLLLRRAGLITREEYLERLGKNIESVQTVPGREVQSLADASYDAWIKYYRADENFVNTGISYYRKGAVVAWLLDARIRSETDEDKSLDDVMRLAFERHAAEQGYTAEQFRALASEVAGTSLEAFFEEAVDGTAELDYEPALDWFGLAFDRPQEAEEEGAEEEVAGWLGAEARDRGGRLVVSEVRRGTPAHAAGLNVDDEIIAIGEDRVPADGLDDRLERHRPGEEIRILVARRGRLRRVDVTLGREPDVSWAVEVAEHTSATQRRHLDEWLSDNP